MSFIDITSKPLRIFLNFRDKGDTGTAGSDHAIPAALLPASVQQLVLTPLSAMLDKFWSGTKDNNNNTMRDRATQSAFVDIQMAAQSQGQSAYDISGSFPATGPLQAEVDHGLADGTPFSVIFLNYMLPGASFTFNTGLAAWLVTFDCALYVSIIVPDFPGSLTGKGSIVITNAQVSPNNFAAGFAEIIGAISNFLTGQPLAIFQNAEGGIDQVVPTNLGDLASLLNQLTPAFVSAVDRGFWHLTADVDAGGLILRLTHPVDAAPIVTDASIPPIPIFQGPVLVPSQNQVNAGSQLSAKGSYFKPEQSTALYIQWTDTSSGAISESDIQWSSSNNTQNASISRTPYDNRNSYTITGLAPNTTYTIQVRDCDQLTCSDWSTPITIKTMASDQVDITLESGSSSISLATVALGTDGTFFAPDIAISSSTPPGSYTLRATAGSQSADVQITVLGAGQAAQTFLHVVNPDTGQVMQPPSVVEETLDVLIQGEGFAPGNVSLSIDSGQTLGSAVVPNSGIFVKSVPWPRGALGDRQIIALESVGGITLQAAVSVFADALPT